MAISEQTLLLTVSQNSAKVPEMIKRMVLITALMLAGCTTTTTILPVPHSKADCETTGIGGDACYPLANPDAE